MFLGLEKDLNAQDKHDWLEDQPPTNSITTPTTNKLSNITAFPRRSTGTIKSTLSGENASCFDIIIQKPFPNAITSIVSGQSKNSNLVWLREYAPVAWQGETDADNKEANGYPFNTSGPKTEANKMFAGHWVYKPYTTLTTGIGTGLGAAETLTVANIANFESGTFYYVIRPSRDNWDNAEHVKITRSGSTLTINERGYKSVIKSWPAGSYIAQHQIANGTEGNINLNWLYNQSTVCPLDGNGKKLNEVFAAWLALHYDKDGDNRSHSVAVCDGIQFDSDVHYFVDGGGKNSRAADFNNDGVADWGFAQDGTNWWGDGLEIYYAAVRAGINARGKSGVIILGGVAETWGIASNNGTQLEAAWSGKFGEDGAVVSESNYDAIDYYFSGMKAQTGHGLIGPRITDVQGKEASAIYYGSVIPTSNKAVRFSYAMTMMFDGAWFSNQNGFGASNFHYFDEDAVYINPGANFGNSVLKTNTADIRANKRWLGNALGQYKRVYTPESFDVTDNLMPNGDFESNLGSWSSNKAIVQRDASIKYGETGYSLKIAPNSQANVTQLDEVLVTGPSVELANNQEYSLCFAIYSEKPSRFVQVEMGSRKQKIFVTTGWSKHVFCWKQSGSIASAVKFYVGAQLTNVWIDQLYLFSETANIFRRDFENGIILANASSTQQTIQLGGTFRRIQGRLDTGVNNGETNLTQITIPAHDGIFLIRQTGGGSSSTRYVKPAGTGDGSSWANAASNLQSTISSATIGDQIWVAAGTYTPGSLRTNSFNLKNGVSIYGGFNGTETILSQRDPLNNVTVLSGNIGSLVSASDNCYHVISNSGIDATAVLDGFTITGGTADGASSPGFLGGGIYNSASSPTIINCIITGNTCGGSTSSGGAGVYNNGSSPTFNNCTFTANTVLLGNGGALFHASSGSPKYVNCLFYNNSAARGGAWYSTASGTATFTNCTFTRNEGTTNGGGLHSTTNSTINLNNCIVWGNTSVGNAKQITAIMGTWNFNNTCYSNQTDDIFRGAATPPTLNFSNSIETNPLFIDPVSDFRIFGNSPCVDSGNDDLNNTTANDVRGETRINATIDRGAYEYTAGIDPASYAWTGSTSTNWHTATNWNTGRVPTASDSPFIPDVANDPIISDAAVCQNLTIETGGKVTIAPAGTLDVSGTLSNNAGTPGLVIKSDATGTGSLKQTSSSVAATVERYLTASKWHQVSVPLTQTIASLLTNPDNTTIPTSGSNRGMVDFDSGNNIWNPFFTNVSEGSTVAGKGYMLRTSVNSAVCFSGFLNSGNVSFPLIRSGANAWNCIGNPYPSAIDLSNFHNENAMNMDANYRFMYIWDESGTSPEYTVHSALVNPVNAQSGQGFFFKSASNGAIAHFTTSMQTHQNETQLKSVSKSIPEIKIIARNGDKIKTTSIQFVEGGTLGLDPGLDAGILKADPTFSIYTRLVQDNGVEFMLQSLPDNHYSGLAIPVGIDCQAGGEINLAIETRNLPAECKLILEDKQYKTFTDLSGSSYSANLDLNTLSLNRFVLHTSSLTHEDQIRSLDLHLVVYAKNNELQIDGPVSSKAIAMIYDLQGRLIMQKRLEAGNRNRVRLPMTSNGIYMLLINDESNSGRFKVFVN